jgi:ATP-binding cassette subfamily C (CFTR/MRP) protein 1
MTRLDSITKAPVIYHFSETVAGLETIRCFQKQESFAQKSLERVNTNMKMDFHNNTANEWLGLRLEAIGVAILCTLALLFVVLPATLIDSGMF